MRLLIVEDDPKVRAILAKAFSREVGFLTTFAEDGKQGRKLLHEQEFDLAILDNILPFVTGRELLVEARRDGITTPIFILTGVRIPFAERDNFRDGAVDFVWKPFDVDTLVERVKARIRETSRGVDPVIRFRDLTYDRVRREVRGEKCGAFTLSKLPSQIFDALLHSRCSVVDEGSLIIKVWGYKKTLADDTLDRNVRRLNSQFAKHGIPKVVRTIKEVGYELIRD